MRSMVEGASRRFHRLVSGNAAMAIRTEPLVGVAAQGRRSFSLSLWLDRESVFSWLMMALPLLFLAAFVVYPFFYGILLSLQDRPVAKPGTFVGLKNFITDFRDPIFWQVVVNTFVYTGVATLLKMIGGLGLALAMNQQVLNNLDRMIREVEKDEQEDDADAG